MRRLQQTYPFAQTVYHVKFTTRFPRSHTWNVLKRMASSTGRSSAMALQRAFQYLQYGTMRALQRALQPWGEFRLHSGIVTGFSSPFWHCNKLFKTSRAAAMQHSYINSSHLQGHRIGCSDHGFASGQRHLKAMRHNTGALIEMILLRIMDYNTHQPLHSLHYFWSENKESTIHLHLPQLPSSSQTSLLRKSPLQHSLYTRHPSSGA